MTAALVEVALALRRDLAIVFPCRAALRNGLPCATPAPINSLVCQPPQWTRQTPIVDSAIQTLPSFRSWIASFPMRSERARDGNSKPPESNRRLGVTDPSFRPAPTFAPPHGSSSRQSRELPPVPHVPLPRLCLSLCVLAHLSPAFSKRLQLATLLLHHAWNVGQPLPLPCSLDIASPCFAEHMHRTFFPPPFSPAGLCPLTSFAARVPSRAIEERSAPRPVIAALPSFPFDAPMSVTCFFQLCACSGGTRFCTTHVVLPPPSSFFLRACAPFVSSAGQRTNGNVSSVPRSVTKRGRTMAREDGRYEA